MLDWSSRSKNCYRYKWFHSTYLQV